MELTGTIEWLLQAELYTIGYCVNRKLAIVIADSWQGKSLVLYLGYYTYTIYSTLAIITRWFSNHESCLLLRSHTCAIIVILDLILYLLRWEKGHWPLDDLWPPGCWGHMCESTQGSLCKSPMKIHQSMWIQWPFLQKLEPKVIDP